MEAVDRRTIDQNEIARSYRAVGGGHTRKATPAMEMEISRTVGSQAVLLYSLTAIIGDCLRVKPYQERQPPRIQILLARA